MQTLMIGGKYETGLSHSRSVDAALPRPNAVWLLYIGAVCGDGGVWCDGLPILYAAEDGGYRHIRGAGGVVSTHLQNSIRASYVECDRCGSCSFTYWTVRTGETS